MGTGSTMGHIDQEGTMKDSRTSLRRSSRALLLLVCTAALTLASAGTALAAGGTTSKTGNTVTFNDAGSTDSNDLEIYASGGNLVTYDGNNNNTAVAPCTNSDPQTVQCPLAGVT
jgi:hypothetical protein